MMYHKFYIIGMLYAIVVVIHKFAFISSAFNYNNLAFNYNNLEKFNTVTNLRILGKKNTQLQQSSM